MGFNFQETKGFSGSVMRKDILRITKTTMSIGDDVMPHMRKGSKLGVKIDPNNQAIQLQVNDNGYTVQSQESGVRYVAAGERFRKLGMQAGDYVPFEGEANVYVRATGLTEGN